MEELKRSRLLGLAAINKVQTRDWANECASRILSLSLIHTKDTQGQLMGHPSSFRVAVFIPPGKCTKKNFHSSHRAPNDIHLKPQQAYSTKNTGHPQHFWGWQHFGCVAFSITTTTKYSLHITLMLLIFKRHIPLLTLSQFGNISPA